MSIFSVQLKKLPNVTTLRKGFSLHKNYLQYEMQNDVMYDMKNICDMFNYEISHNTDGMNADTMRDHLDMLYKLPQEMISQIEARMDIDIPPTFFIGDDNV